MDMAWLSNAQSSQWEHLSACADSQTVLGNYLMGRASLQRSGQTLGLCPRTGEFINLWGCAADLEKLRPENGLGSRFFSWDMSGWQRRQLCGEADLQGLH